MINLSPFPLALMATLNTLAVEPAPEGGPVVEPPPNGTVLDTDAADESSTVYVGLDLSGLPEAESQELEPLIRNELDRQLAAAGLVASRGAARSYMLIRVVVLDERMADYAIDFTLSVAEQSVDPPFGRLRCELCPRAQVVEQIADYLPRALDALTAATPPAVRAEPVIADGSDAPTERARERVGLEPTDEAPPPAPQRPAVVRKARWIGGLGITGIVLATGGVGTVALGTVFIDRGTQRELDRDNDERYLVRDYERTGWILYSAGLAGAALGGLMLALDVTVLHERRLSRLAIQPAIDPSHAGLLLRGRF